MKKVEKLAKEIREYVKSDIVTTLRASAKDILDILDKHAPIEKEFPKFMVCTSEFVDNGMVVLFENNRIGAVVVQSEHNSNSDLGYHSHEWVMDYFKDCEITVKQED
jgi:septum formation topological specificity factor MinE